MAGLQCEAFKTLGLAPEKAVEVFDGLEDKVVKVLERRTGSKEALKLLMAHTVRRL